MPLSPEGKESANKMFKDFRFSLKGIHAAADAFRGTVNGSIDHICHDKKGEEREYAVADKGFRKLHQTDQHFGWNSGVPEDGSQARLDNINWHRKKDVDTSAESSRTSTPAPTAHAATTCCHCTCQHAHAPPALPPRDAPEATTGPSV